MENTFQGLFEQMCSRGTVRLTEIISTAIAEECESDPKHPAWPLSDCEVFVLSRKSAGDSLRPYRAIYGDYVPSDRLTAWLQSHSQHKDVLSHYRLCGDDQFYLHSLEVIDAPTDDTVLDCFCEGDTQLEG